MKKHRLLFLLICCLLLLSKQQIQVYCGANVTKDQLKKNDNANKLWDYCIKKGCSEWWTAAVIGNAAAEHGLKTDIDGSSYFGAFQFASGHKEAFKKFCKDNNYSETDIIAQYEYLFPYRGSCIKTLTGLTGDEIQKDTKYIKDAKSAGAYFAAGMEGCCCWKGITTGKGGKYHTCSSDCAEFDFGPSGSEYGKTSLQELKRRQENTKFAYEIFSGKTPTDSSDSDDTSDTSNESIGTDTDTNSGTMELKALTGRYYSESEMMAYIKLDEININEEYLDDATNSNLSKDELKLLSRWQDNSTEIKTDSTLVKIMRVAMQLFGILITLWGILFYIAYWVDRLNNFIDIDFVSILSLDKLQISEDESDCNFKLTEMKGKGKRTINHAMCLGISVTAIAFGSLIITGILFRLVSKLVIWILHIFDKGVS